MAQGRTRKEGERHNCGKLKQPTPKQRAEDVAKVARDQPHRRGDGSPYVGTAHGRALKRHRLGDRVSGISLTQYEAAEAFIRRRRAFLVHISTGLPKFGSVLDSIVSRGISIASAPDDSAIGDMNSKHTEIVDALRDGGCSGMLDPLTSVLLFSSPDDDPPLQFWSAARPALNCIARRLKIDLDRYDTAQGTPEHQDGH